MIQNWDDILAWWPGPARLARALGVPYQTAASMVRRRSIHARNWSRLIKAAAEKGEVLSADQLVALTDGYPQPPIQRKRNSRKRNKGLGH
jgi:hypothetical protein